MNEMIQRLMNRRLTMFVATLVLSLLAAPSHAQPHEFSRGDELVQLDFKDVELTVVIETIARITGKNFIYDDRVRGRVTIVSPSKVSVDQAYAVFESVLKVKGFTAVSGPGGVLKIIPVRDAKESSIDTVKSGAPSPNRDNFVTRLVPLLYIDAQAITDTIKPLVSKEASLVAYAPTNTIIMTDTEANIRRLLSIVEAIDVESHKEELAVIKVRHADAATLGQQISEIYGANVSATTASRPAARRTSRRSKTATTPAVRAAGQRGSVRIITDDRTNSLLVLASRSQVNDIRGLVRQLDVPLIGGGRIHVYYLRHADAEELAQTLNGMLSGQRAAPTPGRTGAAGGQPQSLRAAVTALAEGITVNADPATNSLVIQASKEAYEALLRVIEKLDIPRPQVLVEAIILEVDITNAEELGIELGYQAVNGDKQFAFSTAEAAATSGTAGTLTSFFKNSISRDTDGNPTPGLHQKQYDVDGILKAAASDSNLNIVSAPHILTSDNEEAEIRIGNNIPIITSRVNSATGNTAGLASSVNVERQDIGVTLRVTPQISEGDTLRLKIFQEITEINQDIAVGDAEQVGVALFNRKVENTVVVQDGDTVVVGGLISDTWTDSVRKVPFLGDIPVLGWAFKSTRKELRKINLLIFLTPHIVRSADEMELESIRKREEFQSAGGEEYKIDEDAEEETEDKSSTGSAPVLSELRKQISRYPLRRKQEIEALQHESERLRQANRLAEASTELIQYGVRVAIYQDETAATNDLTKLVDAGYDGTLVSGETDGSVIYELVVGPFEDLQAADDIVSVLEEVYDYSPSVTVIKASTADSEPTTAPEERP